MYSFPTLKAENLGRVAWLGWSPNLARGPGRSPRHCCLLIQSFLRLPDLGTNRSWQAPMMGEKDLLKLSPHTQMALLGQDLSTYPRAWCGELWYAEGRVREQSPTQASVYVSPAVSGQSSCTRRRTLSTSSRTAPAICLGLRVCHRLAVAPLHVCDTYCLSSLPSCPSIS